MSILLLFIGIGILEFLLGAFVSLSKRRTIIHLSFFAFCLATGLWTLFVLFIK